MSGRVIVLRGDAAHLPLPDASVDLICTSPPYFGLRAYTDAGEVYAGQIGSEATPREFLEALWACTREWMRVLKPEGSLFVNLGDKYDSGTTAPRINPGTVKDGQGQGWHQGTPRVSLGRPKSLLGMPWRYALGCIDDLGLILRAEIVWQKPNGLPESVQDRVRRSHEQVFHFTRSPRYFAAVDEVREPHTMRPQRRPNGRPEDLTPRPVARQAWSTAAREEPGPDGNPLGKLPGSVWEIPSQPLIVPAHLGIDHFAAFPMELPRRIILGWSPAGVCTACGEGRRPVVEREVVPLRRNDYPGHAGLNSDGAHGSDRRAGTHALSRNAITGYACACPDTTAPARPAVVLDPFAGTGTTMLVAAAHGRIGVGVDRSADYCRLAQWRTSDPGEIARAMDVPKPPKQVEGQGSLFDLEAS